LESQQHQEQKNHQTPLLLWYILTLLRLLSLPRFWIVVVWSEQEQGVMFSTQKNHMGAQQGGKQHDKGRGGNSPSIRWHKNVVVTIATSRAHHEGHQEKQELKFDKSKNCPLRPVL
jgi:hypothetical protein